MNRERIFQAIWTLIIVGAIAFAISGCMRCQKCPENPSEKLSEPLTTIQNNSLLPVSPVYIPHTFVYGSLIDCLEYYESRGNPEAIGQVGEIGVLQFKQKTFDMYCKGNIWNPLVQKACADKMLQENFNNLRHWTTANKCI